MSDTNRQSISIEFLLAEFEAQQGQIIKLEEAKSNRINFFLVVVAAAIASTSGVINNTGISLSASMVFAFVAFGILILGIATLNELVHYSEAIVSLYRRAGRVRRWFVDFDVDITPYVAFDATDESPKYDLESPYLAFRGGDSVILLVNSIAFCVFVLSLINLFYTVSMILGLIIGIPSVLLAWLFQQNRLHARLQNVEKTSINNIHFPLKPTQNTKKSDKK